MKNTVVHIVNELRCHFLAITLLCKLIAFVVAECQGNTKNSQAMSRGRSKEKAS